MIELHTGVPGSGKTLNMVSRLAGIIASWGSKPEEARPIFVLGIPQLALPHAELPLKSVQITKAGSPSLVPDWDLIPDGSLVIIDEAQGVFPPRSSASTAPDHVAWLNTHRHHGIDIWITTQHPKLIDGSVRALVGRHRHFRRLFGWNKCMIYEWDSCSDSLSGFKNAVSSPWFYPKNAYKWYKSAEIHTKQKFKTPAFLGILGLGFGLCLYFIPYAYSHIFHPSKTSSSTPSAQAGIPDNTVPSVKMYGYYMRGTSCVGWSRDGAIIKEPPKCRENLE